MSPKVNGESSAPANWIEPSTNVWIPAGNPPTNLEVEAVSSTTGGFGGYSVKRPIKHDPVNHPSHYNQGHIEVLDFLEDQGFNQHEMLAMQYILRAKHKGNEIQDYQKAIWYLDRKVKLLEKGTEVSGR